MGLFSSKKIISVASSAYNLAGDIAKRPNFLKTTILGNAVNNDPDNDIISSLHQSYLQGPGIRLRNFTSWANSSGYNNKIGIVSGNLYTGNSINQTVLAQNIPTSDNTSVELQNAYIDRADYTTFVEQYILTNDPSKYNTNWTANLDDLTNNVTITWEDNSTTEFTLSNYDKSKRYLYAYYNVIKDKENGNTVTGNTTTLGANDSFPNTKNWALISNTNTNKTATLTTTIRTQVSYSNGNPSTDSTSSSSSEQNYTDNETIYTKTEYEGQSQYMSYIRLTNKIYTEYQDTIHSVVTNDPTTDTKTETLSDGSTKTTKITTTTQSLTTQRSYRDDYYIQTIKSWGNLQIYIYQENSGNTVLDNMFSPSTENGEFYPYIPVRLWNEFVGDNYYTDLYPLAKKAYKKATNGKFDDIVSQLQDNKNLSDIDFAYIVFGVSLNTQDNSAKKYIYNFLNTALDSMQDSKDILDNWENSVNAYNNSITAWSNWYSAQSDSSNSLYGTTEPTKLSPPVLPKYGVSITSDNNTNMNYDIHINWYAMEGSSGTGLFDSTRKVNDVWLVNNDDREVPSYLFDQGLVTADPATYSNITIYWQKSLNVWESITVWGLEHVNMIYGGKSVITKAYDALNSSDESGFIIPLQTQIFKSTSLTDSTQMSTSNSYLVINCYQEKKLKWYQTGFFKIFTMIIAIIVIAAITVWTAGAGSVLSAGLMGTGFAVGTAVGLAGFSAALVTAVANSLAVMLITTIVTKVSSLAFGKMIGQILGMVTALATSVISFGSNINTTFENTLSKLSNPSVLIKLASTLTKDIGTLVLGEDLKNTQNKTQDLIASYNKEEKSIANAYETNIGYDTIDASYFSSTLIADEPVYETSDSFLTRSLLTGSDIAKISKSYITNYTDYSLTLNS